MLYILKLAVILAVTAPAALATFLFGLLDPHGKFVYGIARIWAWAVLAAGTVRIRTQGLERLDPHRRYLFMVNHQSNLDIPILIASLKGFQLRWIAKKELLWVPLFGWAMWAAKHITVDRTDGPGALASLKKAEARMASGVSVVVFPEGTRSPDGRLLPFKRGGFLLASKTRTAIVPVTIRGSGKILPKGAWRVRSGEVDILVNEPIATAELRPGKLRPLAADVERLIANNLDPQGEKPAPSVTSAADTMAPAPAPERGFG